MPKAPKVPMAYTTIDLGSIRRNTFDLSHMREFSCRFGELVPVCVEEILPNTTIRINCHNFTRMMPTVAPFFGKVDIKVEYWAVPIRLVWENSEDFFRDITTGGIPTFTMSSGLSTAQKRFFDYMEIPPNATANNVNIVAWYAAAYQKIWNDWYRHKQTTAEITTMLADGNQAVGIFGTMRMRTWSPDYFTAGLPFQQQGSAVDIPLGSVSVVNNGAWSGFGNPTLIDDTGTPVGGGGPEMAAQSGAQEFATTTIPPTVGPYTPVTLDPDGTYQVEATTITDLRAAEALQKFLERLQRSGGNMFYKDFLWSEFGADAKDDRLQLPELITTMKTPLMISEVLNTAGTFDLATGDPTSPPVGSMAGHGIASNSGYSAVYHCPEHMVIIGILSVVPQARYFQGIPRRYLKTDPYEFGLKDFAHLSEQATYKNEIFAYTAGTTGAEPFNYLPMYSEYRSHVSGIAGDLRTSLDFWHSGREFSSLPGFNQAFMEIDPLQYDRLFADTDPNDKFIISHLNQLIVTTPLPVFGTPTI